jgi:uncharacterized phage protein (TIGR01671 family)
MRETKFRAKDLDGNWVEGWYTPGYIHIDRSWAENEDSEWWGIKIQEDTVGQFTGLKAKNCKQNLDPEIYEGDLFRSTEETDYGDVTVYSVVIWIDQYAAFYLVPYGHYQVIKDNDVSKEEEFEWLYEDAMLGDFSTDIVLMKVGNIYDNPELLERSEA